MMTDEIIKELWQVKDQIAKQFNYDVDALVADLQKRQKESGQIIVDLSKEKPRGLPAAAIKPPIPNP
jgi:hypothetical protein